MVGGRFFGKLVVHRSRECRRVGANDVFGARATIYPHGGHCGNLDYRQNVEDMLARFGVAAVAE